MAEEPHNTETSNKISTSSDANAKILMKITISRSKISKKKHPPKRKARTRKKKVKSLELAGENKSVSIAVKKKRVSTKDIAQRSEPANSSVSENGPSMSTDVPDVLVARPKRPRKQYLCSECGRQMKSKSSLDIHIRTHTGARPFMCPICGREFRANGNLTRHQVTSISVIVSDDNKTVVSEYKVSSLTVTVTITEITTYKLNEL